MNAATSNLITATQNKAVIKGATVSVLCESYEAINQTKPATQTDAIAKGYMLCAIKSELYSRDTAAWTAWTNSNMPGIPSKFFVAA